MNGSDRPPPLPLRHKEKRLAEQEERKKTSRPRHDSITSARSANEAFILDGIDSNSDFESPSDFDWYIAQEIKRRELQALDQAAAAFEERELMALEEDQATYDFVAETPPDEEREALESSQPEFDDLPATQPELANLRDTQPDDRQAETRANHDVRAGCQASATQSDERSVSRLDSHQHGEGTGCEASVIPEDPYRTRLGHTIALWLRDYNPDGKGHVTKDYIPLYCLPRAMERRPDGSPSNADGFARIVFFDNPQLLQMLEFNSYRFYIELFFQNRYAVKIKAGSYDTRPSLWDLGVGWDSFIKRIAAFDYGNPSAIDERKHWFFGFKDRIDKFKTKHILGLMWAAHEHSQSFGKGCAVKSRAECPFCYSSNPSMPDEARTPEPPMPLELRRAIYLLDQYLDKKERERGSG